MMRNFSNKKGDRYTVTWDSEAVIDTILKNGKPITAATSEAKMMVKHSNSLYVGMIPPKMAGSGWIHAPYTPWRLQ